MTVGYQDIEKLLPHQPPMVFLEEVTSIAGSSISCLIVAGKKGLCRLNNCEQIPVWLAIEYCAQTAAAFAGWEALKSNLTIRSGLVVSVKSMEFYCSAFDLGQRLLVEATIDNENNDLRIFNCSVFDAQRKEMLVRGTVNVLLRNTTIEGEVQKYD